MIDQLGVEIVEAIAALLVRRGPAGDLRVFRTASVEFLRTNL
jgi:hypothetical protein